MMFGSGLLVLLLAGGLILALASTRSGLLGRWQDSPSTGSQRQATPRQILDERLARGEIDQDEYRAIRARLDS